MTEMKIEVTIIAQDRIEIAKRMMDLARNILIDGRNDHDPVTDEGCRYGCGVTEWKFGEEP